MNSADAARFLAEARRQAFVHRIPADLYEDITQDAAADLIATGARLDGPNLGGFVYRTIKHRIANHRRVAEGRARLGDSGPVGDRTLPERTIDPEACAEPWFWENLRELLDMPAQPRRAESFRAFFVWVTYHGDTKAAARAAGIREDSLIRSVKKIAPFAWAALDRGNEHA